MKTLVNILNSTLVGAYLVEWFSDIKKEDLSFKSLAKAASNSSQNQ